MMRGYLVAKGEKQNNSEIDKMKPRGGHSHGYTSGRRVVSSAAEKRASGNVPRTGAKVIVNISETTYFISRKRWRLLHKQWYVLIEYIIMNQTAIRVYEERGNMC